MRTMASQAANRVESTELPDGRYTHSEETLRELNRVNFLGSVVEAMTLEGDGHPN
jgi:hypothetical protein